MQITPIPPATPRSAGLPTHRPPVGPRRKGARREDEGVDWASLVPLFVHPLKVAIVEALGWVEQPLSASELSRSFGEKHSLGVVAYHLSCLVKIGVIEVTGERQARGARETYYFFSGSS